MARYQQKLKRSAKKQEGTDNNKKKQTNPETRPEIVQKLLFKKIAQ